MVYFKGTVNHILNTSSRGNFDGVRQNKFVSKNRIYN